MCLHYIEWKDIHYRDCKKRYHCTYIHMLCRVYGVLDTVVICVVFSCWCDLATWNAGKQYSTSLDFPGQICLKEEQFFQLRFKRLRVIIYDTTSLQCFLPYTLVNIFLWRSWLTKSLHNLLFDGLLKVLQKTDLPGQICLKQELCFQLQF